MSTTRSQRIGIWVIAIVLAIGTIGSFFVVILANNNQAKDQADMQKLYTDYQAKVTAQTDELSRKYYPVLSAYANRVGAYSADEVTSLSTVDLQEGTGATIDENTTYSAYYIGWNPEGKVFDQSIADGKLKAPLPGQGLIKGWTEGVKGMKLGGVRELTIPADQAYGDTGSGDLIPPHTPIKFIVLAIPTPEAIPLPNFTGSTN